LGLTITKKIIERHGGKIETLDSPEGLEIRMKLPDKREGQLIAPLFYY
jgi:nitrogen fixation/metabolism regulation signal transduction histidine kinase